MSIPIRNQVQAREFQKKVDKCRLVRLNLPPIACIFIKSILISITYTELSYKYNILSVHHFNGSDGI